MVSGNNLEKKAATTKQYPNRIGNERLSTRGCRISSRRLVAAGTRLFYDGIIKNGWNRFLNTQRIDI